jgi:transcriptional regulator with PAS, ATPase and Fis domain
MKRPIPPDKALNDWLNTAGAEQVVQALEALSPYALIGLDAEERITIWNAPAAKLFGIAAEELTGRGRWAGGREPRYSNLSEILKTDREAEAHLDVQSATGPAVRVRRLTHIVTDGSGAYAGRILQLVPEPAAAGATADAMVRGNADGGTVVFHGMASRDPKMQQAFAIIRNVAETESTVLIRGESGTGKELVARAIHELSHRRHQPFLAINCAALTPSLLESELFGHVRGAFTGAIKDHVGLFQRADGGTVFLDEIAELPLDLQAKLLRVLQERTFLPVGGSRPVQVDVRILSATHRALREEVKAGRFREDLMYRLRVVPIFLPPLRERRRDVSTLLWRFIAEHNERGPRHIERIAPEAMRVLLDHAWPGNVRELQNVVEYAFAVGRSPELQMDELPPEFREAQTVAPSTGNLGREKRSRYTLKADEGQLIREALEQNNGNIEAAANQLGMSRATFWRKRKQYDL